MTPFYQINVKGHLDPRWSDWLGGLTITHKPNGATILAGPVVDQPALFGLLVKIRDLNLTLLSLKRIEPTLAETTHLPADRNQRTKDISQPNDVIRRLIEWAKDQVSLRAMLLTSTRANPYASVDLLSDYDVILIVRDIRPFFEDRTWLQDFGDVLVSYWDPIHPEPDYGLEQVGNVIQYADGLKIDFTLWPVELLRRIVEAPALPAELDAGYAILIDKDHLTSGMQGPSYTAYIPLPPSDETYQTFVEEFFSDAPYVAKCLWRDELLPAKWCLDYDMKHIYLRQMLEWQMECGHNWSAPTGALGKGLKKSLPAEIWSQLERTYAGAGIEENWAALFKTMALFRQAALKVADHLGYTYPHMLDQGVTAYVQRIKDL